MDLSRRGKNPPDGRDEELQEQQSPAYVHRCHGSFSQNKHLAVVSQEMRKQIHFYSSQSYSFFNHIEHLPLIQTLQANV